MKKGLIIYNSIDQKKNQWFIDKCLSEFNNDSFSLLYKEESEVLPYLDNNKVDFVIYRGRDYHLVELLENKGIKCFNNSLTNKTANDKYATYLLCKEQGFPCLETLLNNKDHLSYPVIMKSLNGHGGNEVYLINNQNEEEKLLKKSQIDYIYQKYLTDAEDVRLYVLKHQVVGAVKRHNSGDFRSNYSLGGSVSKYEPSQEMVDIAIKVSKLLNAAYIGVDFLIKNEKIYLNEIEDPVGARMLYQTCNLDIVNLFCKEIKNRLL